MAESMRYVRTYPAELPVLRDLLQQIQTPAQIIAGRRDPAVPPANAEFLHDRLPRNRLDILDAGHFTWEDAADEYAALVTTWWTGGYTTATTRSLTAGVTGSADGSGAVRYAVVMRYSDGGGLTTEERGPPGTGPANGCG